MLGLLGLLGAMFAGIMGDSFVNTKTENAEGNDAPPPPAEEPVSAVDGDFLEQIDEPVIEEPVIEEEPAPEPAPEPEVILPPEELPGEGPAETPDTTAQLLMGTEAAEVLTGGAGHDGLLGGTGADTLAGGAGHDALVGADDEDADLLMGEAGNDSLTLGVGDTAMGGDGEDLFSLADFGPNTPPAIIADYSAADDHIILMYDPEMHPEPVVETASIDGTEDMSVMLDGVQIAIVQGAPGLTLADIQLLAA